MVEVREYCCGKLRQAIKDGVILIAGHPTLFSIWGRPCMVNDGDGYIDDCTDEIDISHCPFCGKKVI